MNLPSRAECSELFSKYETPPNVIDHSRKVNQVAVFIARKLAESGVGIDVDLVDRASLLHDLVRIPGQISDPEMKKRHHADVSYGILKDDYPEVAEVVRAHRMEAWLEPETLDTWEKKVVNYADKRVNGDEIVSLADRLRLGRKRWRIAPEKDRSGEILANMEEAEEEIFNKISLDPEDINAL